MSLPVQLVASLVEDAASGTVTVVGDEAHHAVAVRRLRAGEQVILTDGAGASTVGTIAATGKRTMDVTVGAVTRHPRPAPEVVVVQALPKGERGELAVEVLTECGVDRIVPWAAARSVAVWRGERAARSLAKWRATAREAAKQARRSWFPEVTELATTPEVVALTATAGLALVLHEDAAEPLAGLLAAGLVPASGRVVVVVGPEGGLTEAEVAAFVGAGGRAVRLGPEVLRTSTAGLAAVAALLAHTPRWA